MFRAMLTFDGLPSVGGLQAHAARVFDVQKQTLTNYLKTEPAPLKVVKGEVDSLGRRIQPRIADHCRAELPGSAGVPGFHKNMVGGEVARYYCPKINSVATFKRPFAAKAVISPLCQPFAAGCPSSCAKNMSDKDYAVFAARLSVI